MLKLAYKAENFWSLPSKSFLFVGIKKVGERGSKKIKEFRNK